MPFPVHAAKKSQMFVDIIPKISLNAFANKHKKYISPT